MAVVTGASSGIGASIARRLSGEGWHCVLLARGRERLESLSGELGAEWELCDVGDRAQVERVAAAVLERHPRIGLLVNNAGVPARTGFLGRESDPERIEQVMRTNYLGSVWSLRAFLPGLEAALPADVVNVVSVAGHIAFPPSGPYSASKHAQLAFSRAAAAELRPRGIRVHAVCPGFVETEGFPQERVLRSSLLRRVVIGPDQVARHILEVLAKDRRETFVPAWYRAFTLVQAVAPGLVARVAARSGSRGPTL